MEPVNDDLAKSLRLPENKPATLNGHTFQNLEAFAPEADWEELSHSEDTKTHAHDACGS